MPQTTSHSANTFTSYSSFFSSGLLAQSGNPRLQRRDTFNSDISEPWDDEFSDSSCPSSPVALPDESVMDIDIIDTFASTLMRRSATPTPRSQNDGQGETTPVQGASTTSKYNFSTSQNAQPTPRLRRRRSSLTQATSPMNSIRSSTRSAGNALHLQRQIPATPRSRSGSIGNDTVSLYAGVATEGTSLVGRMRSGSCSSVISLPAPVSVGVVAPISRPRRAVRRIPTTPMPALRAPPPNAPLPALPLPSHTIPAASIHVNGQVKLRPANVNLTAAAQASSNSLKSPTSTSARARGLSVSNSGLDGAENRIDEMKEN